MGGRKERGVGGARTDIDGRFEAGGVGHCGCEVWRRGETRWGENW